jgi:hypothetical protein
MYSTHLEPLAHSLLNLAQALLNHDDSPGIHDIPALTTPFSNTTQGDWAEAVRLWNIYGRPLIRGQANR